LDRVEQGEFRLVEHTLTRFPERLCHTLL
jgi:hypothetical protein